MRAAAPAVFCCCCFLAKNCAPIKIATSLSAVSSVKSCEIPPMGYQACIHGGGGAVRARRCVAQTASPSGMNVRGCQRRGPRPRGGWSSLTQWSVAAASTWPRSWSSVRAGGTLSRSAEAVTEHRRRGARPSVRGGSPPWPPSGVPELRLHRDPCRPGDDGRWTMDAAPGSTSTCPHFQTAVPARAAAIAATRTSSSDEGVSYDHCKLLPAWPMNAQENAGPPLDYESVEAEARHGGRGLAAHPSWWCQRGSGRQEVQRVLPQPDDGGDRLPTSTTRAVRALLDVGLEEPEPPAGVVGQAVERVCREPGILDGNAERDPRRRGLRRRADRVEVQCRRVAAEGCAGRPAWCAPRNRNRPNVHARARQEHRGG